LLSPPLLPPPLESPAMSSEFEGQSPATETVVAEGTSQPTVEPGLCDELHKIASALRTSPFHPEVSYVLHWRDPIRSGLLFGIVNLAYFLITYGEYSVVTLFNYCALALLAAAFAYANGLILWARYIQGVPIENPLSSRWASSKTVVSRTVIEKHVDSLYNLISALLDISRDIYYCCFPLLSLKFAGLFFTFSLFGKWFSGFTIIYFVIILVFAWPRLYEEKKTEIDQYFKLVHDQVTVYVDLAISKLPKLDKRKAQ